jgi:dethiobiotin synthetase
VRGFFVTGTDTNVGKTVVSAMLIRAMRRAGVKTAGFKPLCCGERTDAELLAAASGCPVNDVNPVWLRPAVAPYPAAMIEGRMIDMSLVRETFTRLASSHTMVVEGAGGWFVPIERNFSMADLAVEFGLPVVVVVANRLGCINHTLLTLHAIRSAGLTCAGIVLNHVSGEQADAAVVTNRAILEELIDVPVLAEVAFGQSELDLWPGALG